MIRRPQKSTLFPSPPLFRSRQRAICQSHQPLGDAALRTIQTGQKYTGRFADTVGDHRVGETPCVFLAGLYRAERGIAERSEEHTSELQSLRHLVCPLLLEKK